MNNTESIEVLSGDDLESFKETVKTGELSNICKNEIGDAFIDETIDSSDYAVLHYANPNTENLRGFALVTEKEKKESDDCKKYLYIDLICNLPNHKMGTRSNKNAKKTSGKDIINAVINMAKEKKIPCVKLSAIQSVITYYNDLFGFSIDYKPKNKNRYEELLSELRKKQNDIGFSKIALYQPNFLKDTHLSKEEKISKIDESGIKMTLKLDTPPQSKKTPQPKKTVKKGGKNRKKSRTRKLTKQKRKNKSKSKRYFTR